MADPLQTQGDDADDNDSLDASQGQTPNQDADDDEGLGGFSPDAQAEIRKLRAEAKKRRLGEREALSRVKAYEDRDKTEEQRRQEELVAATARATRAEQQLLRYEVAAEHGIPQHAGRLQGDTRDALAKDAKALAREFGLAGDADNGGGRADFSSGVRRPIQRPKTMNDLIRQAAGR